MQRVIIYLFLSFSLIAHGGNLLSRGPLATATGGLTIAGNPYWGVLGNQARLADITSLHIGFTAQSRFLIKELGFQTIGAAIPISKGTLGISLQNMGYSSYRELNTGIAYAMKLGKNISAAVQINYYSTLIAENYQNQQLIIPEIGVLWNISDKLTSGLHLYNPFEPDININSSLKAPSIITMELLYQIHEHIALTSVITHHAIHAQNYSLGFIYTPVKKANIILAVATHPSRWSMGVSFEMQNITLIISAMNHERLGITPDAGIIWTP